MIEIYADGACSGNPGPGGWGALLRVDGAETELCGGDPATTNNRMELRAVIEALQSFKEPIEAQVYTDSQYVQKGISEWIHSWKRRNWKTVGRDPVKNEDLWRRLDALAARHSLQWHWIRGHAGHVENERADALARAGLEQARSTGTVFGCAADVPSGDSLLEKIARPAPASSPMSIFGGIEAGGTKFVCGIGTSPDDLTIITIPTESPDVTIEHTVRFFAEHARQGLSAIGIGSFGPVDLDPDSETYGYITSTPKPGWRNIDINGALARALNVPVAIDTDVNAAALAEARWGAGLDMQDFIYLTVGTGIGGAAMVGGRVVHGLMHPEMGHIKVPHDFKEDPFAGICPFHNDCLEGLASGTAMRARWGISPDELPENHPAWSLEAHYLALALHTWVCTLSPRRIILGGGVMQRQFLFPLIRSRVKELLNEYLPTRALMDEIDGYIVPPRLGGHAGVLGALLLAKDAQPHRSRSK
ncbi:hypothetical protein W02_39460 [Nitrospira sp. KM1]|uniref:ribonuclease HI n=1 Tax=Nitrospira sp. KM1 TaxID=1936990 RepID=UPI0013A78169|nr:ribonuclease HI [Nitrospira sp. KM1]BCA56806.1 hypothetical protein W02_39460 [Nitrospira sp. KM1]